MCLAIPMQITAIDGYSARCTAKGVERDISLFLLQNDMPAVGEYVKVSVGFAVQRVDEVEARLAWELLDQILDEIGPAP